MYHASQPRLFFVDPHPTTTWLQIPGRTPSHPHYTLFCSTAGAQPQTQLHGANPIHNRQRNDTRRRNHPLPPPQLSRPISAPSPQQPAAHNQQHLGPLPHPPPSLSQLPNLTTLPHPHLLTRGLTPHHGSQSITFDILATDIAHLLSTFHIQKTHAIIGVSIAGATALQFALKYPKRTERVVIASIFPKSPEGMQKLWDNDVAIRRREDAVPASGEHVVGNHLAELPVRR